MTARGRERRSRARQITEERFKKLYGQSSKKNDRIMDQVLDKYDSMRKVLGPFDDELEAIWRTTGRLNPAMQDLERKQAEATKASEALTKATRTLNDRLEDQRRRLLNLPTDEAIREFDELTQVWEGLNDEVKKGEVLERYTESLKRASDAGHDLDEAQLKIIKSTRTAKKEASGYELALAGIAGEIGGATGKMLNLVLAMREHNKEQQAAAEAGEKTEAQFSKIRLGAGHVAVAFASIGDAVGGTAGKVMTEIGNIAAGFATGGIWGAVIAGIGSLAKGIAGLFNRGKRKREEAAKAAAKWAEAEKQAAEKAKAALDAYWDSVYAKSVPAYDRAKAAGVAAFDAILLASLSSGLGQEQAVAKATAAQLAATQKVLAAEGDKFVRLAAFDAALLRNPHAGTRKGQPRRPERRRLKRESLGKRRSRRLRKRRTMLRLTR